MAWVRIHDGAMSHPKLVGLIDWKNAFCLWVWGLSYCQTHLTDGRIVKVALPNPTASKTAQRLVSAGLWADAGDAFEVHDYLTWNDSRDVVMAKRNALKQRVTRHRERVTERVTNASVTSGVVLSTADQIKKDDQTLSVLEGVQGKPALPRSSGRQMGRIFLHRWQLDELIATLGEYAAGFELDVWLDELSRRQGVLPADRWAWVKAELQAEVLRRGLPVAAAPQAQSKPYICNHVPPCVDDVAHTARKMREKREVGA